MSNLINKTRLYEGWPVHMKTKCKDQGDTCDCRTLTEKRGRGSSENVTAFTLTAGEGDVPDYIIRPIISQ